MNQEDGERLDAFPPPYGSGARVSKRIPFCPLLTSLMPRGHRTLAVDTSVSTAPLWLKTKWVMDLQTICCQISHQGIFVWVWKASGESDGG